MRITNNMTTTRTLLDINRNAMHVNKLYNQLTTGKKIQMPSDDPIIASRALKFRTNISETEQYTRNVAQGVSWMEITEQGFTNTTSILKSIRDLCVQAANDPLEATDRQKISTEIQSLFEEIGAEMNITYAGRYVFSGYRTDEPPIITEDNKASFNITQLLETKDMEFTKAYYKAGTGIEPEVHEVTRLKLPYNNATGLTQIEALDGTGAVAATYAVTPKSVNNQDAYTPGVNEVYYVQETGELILGADVAKNLNAQAVGGIQMNYTKEGFVKGDINPKVYFECTQTKDVNGLAVAPPKVYSMKQQSLQFEFGTNTQITINNLSKDVYTASLYADLKALTETLAGIKLSTEAEIRSALTAQGVPADQMDEKIKEQQKAENQWYRGVLQDRFSNMLKLVDTHNAQVAKEYTDLGSRINRLELIGTRLEEDKVSYTKLMDDNENVDYLEAIMRFNTANSVYQAALQASGKILQISLADFIR